MPINYKKELESTAKNMILAREPYALIKMILRTVAQKIKVSHASILLYDKDKQSYILADSRGSLASRLPIGLARVDKDSPLIHFFKEQKNKVFFKYDTVIREDVKRILKRRGIDTKLKQLLAHVAYQMEVFDTAACVPSYFRDDLLALLLVGKKRDNTRFNPDELNFFSALSSSMAMAIKNVQLFKELEFEFAKKHQMFLRITVVLAAAIEAKDNYTHGHTTRVTNLSLNIAQRLNQAEKAFNEKFFENLHIASLLHDIGKIGIPEYILNKKSDLTIGERNRIEEHPLIGATILQPIKELSEPILGVKYHHERYDGSGYPEGLKEDNIPLIASIISVADTFDAMTTDRPYRLRLSKEKTFEEIKRVSGKQLNPRITETLLSLGKEGKI
ncbi:MAG: HD domain-containing protein [Candidatus Omnitrophica bacterium]|nr:HD domain-containing protein [Candidatus Omnitrophota bacterium]